MNKNKLLKTVITLVLVAFALVTVFMSSAVLFDWFGIRAKQRNYVPFVVKTNLTAGFIYLMAAYGFIKSQKWALWAMLSAALLLLYTSALFYVHIHTGGLYETRTINAMVIRVLFTLILAVLIYISMDREI